MLAKVLREREVKHIYCLVRAASPELARSRVIATLEAKAIPALGIDELSKITFLPADLSQPSLGLDETITNELLHNLSVVIHSAWAVNFNIGVRSFEQQHIRGAYNLINLCLRAKTAKPARFYFCSSISAAAGTPLPAVIKESHIDDLSHAQSMGYARSKLVTEQIVKAAGEKTGLVASVLRIGQIVGDTTSGLWNTTEAIPLMIQSVNALGALPELDEVRYSSRIEPQIDADTLYRTRHGCLSTSWQGRLSSCQAWARLQVTLAPPAPPSITSRTEGSFTGREISSRHSDKPVSTSRLFHSASGYACCGIRIPVPRQTRRSSWWTSLQTNTTPTSPGGAALCLRPKRARRRVGHWRRGST